MNPRPLIGLVLACAAYATGPAGGAADVAAPVSAPSTGPATRAALTDAEKEAGWKLLFDGSTPAGWRGLGADAFPAGRWVVQDGCLRCLGNANSKAKPNDLVADGEYADFEIEFEWMVPKKMGNSGFKYRVQEVKGNGSAFGCEYQLMYDPGVEGKDATGSLYDVLPPAGKKLNPQGEFNRSRVLVHGDHVEHWLNGVKVLEYDFGSDDFKAAVARSKFKGSPTWAREPRGRLVLQDHGDEAWFRNIKIRELKAP